MRAGGIHWAATMDAKGFADGAARVKREASGLRGGLEKELKAIAGRNSIIGNIGEVFSGGGAIAGLSVFANELRNTAVRAAQLREELARGQVTASEYKRRLVEVIPVLGGIAQAGREAGEAIGRWWYGIPETEVALAKSDAIGRRFVETLKQISDERAKSSRRGLTDGSKAMLDEAERHKKITEQLISVRRLANEEYKKQVAININNAEADPERFKNDVESHNEVRRLYVQSEQVARNVSNALSVEGRLHRSNIFNILKDSIKGVGDSLVETKKKFDDWVASVKKADRDLAKSIRDSSLSPKERYDKEISEINRLNKNGSLSNADAKRARDSLYLNYRGNELISLTKELFAPVPRPTVALRGSQAAFSALNAPSQRRPTKEQIDAMMKIANQQLTAQEETNRMLKEAVKQFEVGN